MDDAMSDAAGAAPREVRVQVTETREDGETVFRDEAIPLDGGEGPLAVSAVMPAAAMSFRWTPAEFDFDFHPAPRRRLVMVTDGALEITVSSGEARVFRPGDVLSIRDTWGRGHRSRALGGPFSSAFIALDDEVLLDRRAGAAPPGEGVDFVHNRETAEGVSFFERKRLPFVHGGPEGRVTEDMPLTGFRFVHAGPDLAYDWHPAPRRQIVLCLTGGVVMEYGDGTSAEVGPGGFLVGEDVAGRGHVTRAWRGAPRLSVFAHLADVARF